MKCPKFRRENNETLNDDSMSESEDRYINSVEFDPLQRKDFCRLLLTLIQNVDMSLAQLSTKILANQDGFEIHQGKYYYIFLKGFHQQGACVWYLKLRVRLRVPIST